MTTSAHQWRDQVLLDASGELGEDEQTALRRQLAVDPELRAFAATVTAVTTHADDLLPDGAPRTETLARIDQAAQAACDAGRVVRFPVTLRPLLALAASLLLVAGIWVATRPPVTVPHLGPSSTSDGVAVLDDLLAVVVEPEVESGAADTPAPATLEGLAEQLLRMQGFAAEEGVFDDAAILLPAPAPTALRERSTSAVPAGRCV